MIKLPWASFEDQTRRLAGHVSPQLVAFGDPSGSQFYNSKVQSKNYSAIKHGNGKFMEMQFLIYIYINGCLMLTPLINGDFPANTVS